MKVNLINENYKDDWLNQLLMARGVAAEDIDRFKNPTTDLLSNPFNLDNCELAANLILLNIANNEHFGMVVDCDVDGICSAAYNYIHEINPNIEITYYFHEHKQHGLEDCWEKFIDDDIKIVLEMDAGINDKLYHDKLGEYNIFTIVGDHHEYENMGFSDHAIYVDNQISEKYTNKNLAGCGVTWQLCRAMDELNNTDYAFKYIDLVALGCCADVMSPLSLENRFIFDYGFSHVQYPTFKKMIEKQSYSMQGVVDYTSVAFYIAPLINACMRTGTAEEKLLMYKGFLHPDREVTSQKRGAKGEQVNIIDEMIRVLTNVKSRQKRTIDKYMDMIDSRIQSEGLDENNIIVVHLLPEDDFDSELNGLIGMKLSEKYHKPCIVIRDGLDNETKGSMRNPNGSPIKDLKKLIAASPYTTFTAGHANAAGLGIKTPYIDKFIDWFNEQTNSLSFNENSYDINFIINQNDHYCNDLCLELGKYNKLWGGNNIQPIIYLNDIKVTNFTIMGKSKDTIKFDFNGLKCILFKSAELAQVFDNIKNPIIINAIGKPSLNIWNGVTTPQLIIDDLEWHEESIFDF